MVSLLLFVFFFCLRDLWQQQGVSLRHGSRLLQQVTQVEDAVQRQAADVDTRLGAGVGDLRSSGDGRGGNAGGHGGCAGSGPAGWKWCKRRY